MCMNIACGSRCPKGDRSRACLLRVLHVGPYVPDSKMDTDVTFGPTCTTTSRSGLLWLRLLHVGPTVQKVVGVDLA